MKSLWPSLLILFVSLTTDVNAQEVKHAPTVAQCQADGRLWLKEAERSGLDYETMEARARAMLDCESVDPANQRTYSNVGTTLIIDQAKRVRHFLFRHGLYDQFIKEDREGEGR